MPLRLIEIVLKEKDTSSLRKFLKECEVIEHTELPLLESKVLTRILLSAEDSEMVLTFLDEHYTSRKTHNRVTVLPVEATLPRAEEPVEPPAQSSKPAQERVAIAELYEDIKDSSGCTKIYIAMVVLSTLVAAVGLHNDRSIVILGGMLIAPMLGPIIALSLGITLGDLALLRRALLTGLTGIAIALLLSTFIGVLVQIDPTLIQIIHRTHLVYGDLAVALASGCAGALAFTTGVPATLIGVMVAVSLLPPLVTAGLLLGAGHSALAGGAFLAFLMNFISVNVASVIVFLMQGIYPKSWTEDSFWVKLMRGIILSSWILILIAFLVYFRLNFFEAP